MAMAGKAKSDEVGKLIGFLETFCAELIKGYDVVTLQLRKVFRDVATCLASKTISFASRFTLFTPIPSVVRDAAPSSLGVAYCRQEATEAAKSPVAFPIRNRKSLVAFLTYQADRGMASQMLGLKETFSRTVYLPIGLGGPRLCKGFKGVMTSWKSTCLADARDYAGGRCTGIRAKLAGVLGKRGDCKSFKGVIATPIGANFSNSWFDAGCVSTDGGAKALVARAFERALAILTDFVHDSFSLGTALSALGRNKAVEIAAGSGATLVP